MPPTIIRLPSKMRTEDGYHRFSSKCRFAGSSNTVQPSPVGDAHGSKIRMACVPGWIVGLFTKPFGSPPTLIYERCQNASPKHRMRASAELTIDPLLINAPLAQNELVKRSSGVTVLS